MDVFLSRQKYQLNEIVFLKEQVSEIAQLKSDFIALKNELAEVKEENKRYEKKTERAHTKNTKAQEEICFIVRSEADKVFNYPSEQTTDAHLPILPSSATHTSNLQHHQPW